IPRRSRRQTTNVVESEIHTNVTMADNRTMTQMLQAPIEGSSGLRRSSAMPRLLIHVIYAISLSLYPFTERYAQPYFFSCLIRQAPIEGYEDAIVVPPINANNFELKQTLINLVQSNQFTRRQDPHNHLRFFNKLTSTFRHPEVPNTTVKLLLFPFSLEGEARIWLDKEPSRSILTWEDLVPQDYNVSSATPCLFIHSTYVMYCLYIRSLSVMLSRILFMSYTA
nr:reverse transcriptase domain-containing protein [Tanacetum cinerariifolium]